ncbi:MAG: AMP-binding enzyme [Lutispora sp.]
MVRNRVSPFASPQEIEFMDELPKTETGKIMRRCLK